MTTDTAPEIVKEAPVEPATEAAKIIPLFADGLRGESVNDAYRLERALKRVRKLLNDPVALRLRAQALIDGTAKPLLALAIVGLSVGRMVGGPPSVPSYYLNGLHRRNPVVAVAPAVAPRAEVA